MHLSYHRIYIYSKQVVYKKMHWVYEYKIIEYSVEYYYIC